MSFRTSARVLACAAVFSLTACHSGTPATRINAALPPGPEVASARDKFLATSAALQLDAKAFEAEWTRRLEQRATDCAKDYTPSPFADDAAIREALTDKDCFADRDAALRHWLEARRIGHLLAAPPLRPATTGLPRIQTVDRIHQLHFAENAGIAIAVHTKHFEVIDTNTGTVLKDIESDTAGLPSPNGRLLVVNRGTVAEIRDAQTNEVLASYPDVLAREFFWANDVGAFYRPKLDVQPGKPPSLEPAFIDFTSGTETRIPMGVGMLDRVLPVPGSKARFALLAFNRKGIVELKQDTEGTWKPELLSQGTHGGYNWSTGDIQPTADGRYLAAAHGDAIALLPLDTLEPRTITLAPMYVNAVIPLADPDKLLFTGYFRGGDGTKAWVYSFGMRSLAQVDTAQLISSRIIWLPRQRINAMIDETRLVALASVPTGQPDQIDAALERASLAAQASAADMRAHITRLGVPPASQAQYGVGAVGPTVQGPLLDIAKTADVRAIGVYQGDTSMARDLASRYVGNVNVIVRKSARPTVLVLSSHDPVRWVITLQEGARLAAVVQSSYHPSEVIGAGGARVFNIGQAYAYSRGNPGFATLDATVERWTGKRIGGFQGAYTGKMFILGL